MAGELQRPLTRGELNRLLIGNALLKPWPNVLLPAGLAIAGLLVGLPLGVLVAIALVAWLALSAITYFDADEAERVAKQMRERRRAALGGDVRIDPRALAGPVGAHLGQVLAQEARIREAIERADLPFSEVSEEVDTFVRLAERTAGRAQLLYEYLAEQDPRQVGYRLQQVANDPDPSKRALAEALRTQMAALERAQKELDGFYTEMERIAVELGNIRGQLLSVSSATEAAAQRQLASDVRDLREQMGAVADGMSEALAETGAASGPS
jgi:signal transduction histidine kinase